MPSWKIFTTILLLVFATPCLADERLRLDSKGSISIDEVNKKLEAKGAEGNRADTIYFGFDLRAGPIEDARQYLPFLDYLARSTGYNFKLQFTAKDSSIVDDLGAGNIAFAAIGAVSFLQAREKYDVQILVRGVNSDGATKYRSNIVVAPTSAIQDIENLKGKRFAFGSISSTQGHLIPRIILAERGIDLSDFAAYEYTRSHENCANAVIRGDFDACGMQDTMARRMERAGLVRILHTSQYYPSSGIAANKDVPPAVVERVKLALLNFDPTGRDREGLYNWQATEMPNGFQAATAADYRSLRDWSIRFGFLEKAAAPANGTSPK